MAEDTRDYIERTQSRAVGYMGKELTPDEMAAEFMKCDIDARVSALEGLAEDRGELSIKDASRRYSFESALRATHEKLRKIGR